MSLSCTVFEIFDDEECRDLQGHSRSLEMTPFDRSHTLRHGCARLNGENNNCDNTYGTMVGDLA